MKTDTAERYDQFQMLRGVACLMVFANHVVGYLSTPLNLPSTGWVAPLIVPLGFPWVWLFLVLSGFLLTKSFATGRYELTGQGIRRFYAARARRLLPLIWFAIVLWTVLYSLGLWSRGLPPLNAFREMGIAFVAPWVPYFASTNAIASVNSPIWSAVIEVHYCLVMPFLLLLGRLSKAVVAGLIAAWVFGILLLLASVVWSGGPEIFPSIYGNHFYNVGFFFAAWCWRCSKNPPLCAGHRGPSLWPSRWRHWSQRSTSPLGH